MNVLAAVFGFALAIGVLVVVHEFGHYIVARAAGVKVLRFSVGFGQPLWRHVSRSGTEWTIAWLPLGGYVKMLDERDAEQPIPPAELPRAFNRQSVGKRMAIVVAGPVANFILAIVLFAVVFVGGVTEPAAVIGTPVDNTPAAAAGLAGGETVDGIRISDRDGQFGATQAVRSWNDLRWHLLDAALDQRQVMLMVHDHEGRDQFTLDLSHLPAGSIDKDVAAAAGLQPGGAPARVAGLEPDSAASRGGLRNGDLIRTLDGRPVTDAAGLIATVRRRPGKPVTLGIERDGASLQLPITPQSVRDADGQTIGRIGAMLDQTLPTVEVHYRPLEALQLGVSRTWDISVFSLRMFGRMLVGEASLRNLSGPVTIADYAGKSVQLGVSAFLSFLALISISLGVLNLLPIPVLDGGHLLYYAVEVVTGRAVSERWQAILQRAGLVCIFALSALALFNDLNRLIHF